jgi:hypothetical protein
LKLLWLAECQITDDALPSLLRLQNLEQLDLTGTRISTEALRTLQQELPQLQDRDP